MVPELREEILLVFKDYNKAGFYNFFMIKYSYNHERGLHSKCNISGFRRQGALLDYTLHNSPEECGYILVYL